MSLNYINWKYRVNMSLASDVLMGSMKNTKKSGGWKWENI